MKQRDPENRIRPGFVAFLVVVLAIILIPTWMLTRSTTPKKMAAPASAPITKTQREPRIPQVWHRVVTPPRGASVSKLARMVKPAGKPVYLKTDAPSLEERWGIRMRSARLSMGNAFLDLRYEILDPQKAAFLASRFIPGYVQDCSTGTTLAMVAPPREGGFPPTGNRITTGAIYSAVVGNKNGILKSGKELRILVGDSVATNLIIDKPEL